MRYQAVIDPQNKNNSHSITIDFIAEFAHASSLDILDVGCSAGYLGEYLCAQGHHVTGIDITPEAIEKAAEFLNEAYCMKVEDYFIANPHRRFDVVIFGDVLEHVTNAEEVLRLTALALKPRGRVIASIPNVGHLAVRAMLLEGRWEYANLGLLDRDHVRFFTRQTIKQLFLDSGYDVQEMRTTNLSVETVDKICGMHLNPVFIQLAKNAAGNDDSASVFQYVTMAQAQSNTIRVVCFVPEMKSGLFGFRVRNPLENWAKRYGGDVRYRLISAHKPEDFSWGDVFLFQRSGGAYVLNLIKLLKAHGKRVVFEIDDLLTDLPDFLSHHRGSPATQASLKKAIYEADVVTTTTPRLAQHLSSINAHIECIPNCIDTLPVQREPLRNDHDLKATLIVASSDTVLVECLLEPLRQIQHKYGDKVKIVVVGPIARAFAKGEIKFERVPTLPYPKFIELLQSLVFPIGLIPLDDSLFSSCKSPIKFFDYACADIPTICSKVPPYSDYVVHQQNGILTDNSTEAWVEVIETLIQSEPLRHALAQSARECVVATHLIDRAGDAWQKVIENLHIDRKAVDNQSLSKAVDALAVPIKPNVSPIWIAKKLLRYQTYINLGKVLREEGFAGVKRRVLRW